MEFVDLKKAAKKQIDLQEPDFMKENDDSLNIGYLDLNATQKLIFSLSTFKGKKYFDIRTWIQSETGDWTPTKKGVHLTFEKYEEFASLCKIFGQVIELDQ